VLAQLEFMLATVVKFRLYHKRGWV